MHLREIRALNRRIYASFPMGYRIAHVMLRLASDTIDTLGRFIAAEFIKAGLQGLPDINGEPAEAWKEKVVGPSGPNKLPRNYGREFAKQIYARLMSKSGGKIELVEDVLSELMLKLLKGGARISESHTLKEAQGYVQVAADHLLLDTLKSQRRKHNLNMPMLVDEEGATFDVSDPNSFKDLNDLLPTAELNRMFSELERYHPRAKQWVQFQFEGMTDKEIGEQWGDEGDPISKSGIKMWENKHLPKIKQIMTKYLQDAAA